MSRVLPVHTIYNIKFIGGAAYGVEIHGQIASFNFSDTLYNVLIYNTCVLYQEV